jgi:hypothetical protein
MAAKNHPSRNSGPAPVLADHGQWRQVWSDGRIVGYEGRFPKGDYSEEALVSALNDAEGVAWFLAADNIIPRPPGVTEPQKAEQKETLEAIRRKGHRRGTKTPDGWFYRPEDTPDAYVVRVTQDRARLNKFEHWAHERHFLPDHQWAQEADERAATLQAWRSERAAGAINNALKWEKIGAEGKPGLRATTRDPHLAYALAIHLKNEDYLDGRAFGKLYWQACHAVREEKAMEFQLTIQSDQVERFLKQFPNACSPKTLSGLWVEKTPSRPQPTSRPFDWHKGDTITPGLFER